MLFIVGSRPSLKAFNSSTLLDPQSLYLHVEAGLEVIIFSQNT